MAVRWSGWKKSIDLNSILDIPIYSGPACYMLGFAGPRSANPKTKYIGETSNLHTRIAKYASNGSHCSIRILMELRQGYFMYYRFVKTESKAEAKKIQDTLWAKYPQKFPWNGDC
jgi:hypothetical protein